MSSNIVVPEPAAGLSQVERVVDTFVAPSKTFADILRSSNWFLPFLLLVLLSVVTSFIIDKKVGFDRVAENTTQQSPKAMDQMSQLTPEQRAQRMALTATINKVIAYAFPVFILVFVLLEALMLWASFNFGLGSTMKFGQVVAVLMYSSLPKLLLSLLTIVTLVFGNNQESFDIKNAVGTNPGFYLPDAALWLKTLLSWFDVVGIWSLILLVFGMAIVARKSTAQSAAIVVGWWLLGLLLTLGSTIAFN